MGMKKGFYFTIDGLLALGMVVTAIVVATSFQVDTDSRSHLYSIANDMLTVMGSNTVVSIDNIYVNSLISGGDITNLENTVLEQIVVFWNADDFEKANKTVQNVSTRWITNRTGVGFFIDNQSIFESKNKIQESLVSVKRITTLTQNSLSRQTPPEAQGPFFIEVRIWE
jgi:hypothetical protein